MRGYLDRRGRWHRATTRDIMDLPPIDLPPVDVTAPANTLVTGGGADLSKYDTTNTNVSPTDNFTNNNDKYFQSSNLDEPSTASEPYHALSNQMTPSEGAGSGNIEKNSMHNDAQWIRQFSLILYGSSSGGGSSGSSDGSSGGSSSGASVSAEAFAVPMLGGYRRNDKVVPFRRPGTRDDSGGDYGGGGDDFGGGGDSSGGSGSGSGGGQSGGHDLSNLRCTFSVTKTTNSTPNMLYARVYNMSPATMGKVIQFTRVQVSAGYKYANYGLIFDGVVIQYRRGKENPVDTYLEIHAGDGNSINDATLTKSYDAGTTREQIRQDFIEERKKLEELKTDQVTSAPDKLQRRRVIIGHIRELERQWNREDDTHSFTENGAYQRIKKSAYLDNEAVILSPKTGLVGLPEVTPQGIQIRCLLNPKIKLGGLVQIDNKVLSGVAYTPGTQAATDDKGNITGPGQPTGGMVEQPDLMDAGRGQTFETAFTSPTGRYKVLLMTISGDTRGNPWYCDMICCALNSKGEAIIGSNTSNAFSRASQEARGDTQIASTVTRLTAPRHRRIDVRQH